MLAGNTRFGLTDARAADTIPAIARVAELADARDSKSRDPRGRVGSTPTSGTARCIRE